MDIGPTELIIILLIVIMLFGVGRVGKIAGEPGSGIRAFREGLGGDEADEPAETKPAEPPDHFGKVNIESNGLLLSPKMLASEIRPGILIWPFSCLKFKTDAT